MKVLITGSTGMIGGAITDLCIASEKITSIISLTRRGSERNSEKLTELFMGSKWDYKEVEEYLSDIDIVYYCLGVYTGSVNEEMFIKLTLDFPLELAEVLISKSPNCRFCLLSGQGADRTEESQVLFAKYKGMIENKISALGFKSFHSFRPAYIYPVNKRKEPNIAYSFFRLIYPIVSKFLPNRTVKSTRLANTIFEVGINGHEKEVLENIDILRY